MANPPPMSPEEIEARDRTARGAHMRSRYQQGLWNVAWEAARHYYRTTHSRKNMHMIQYDNGAEAPYDDYELHLIRHLVKKAPLPRDEFTGEDLSEGWTYWQLRKGKTWEDIDRALQN